MSRDATEHEMIERLVDGVRTAADRVQDVCRAIMLNAPVMPRTLIALRRNLRQASGSAHQLGHAQSNPTFFDIRDHLDDIAKNAMAVAMLRNGLVMAMLGAALDKVWREADRIAKSRAMPRADVLAALDVRQKAVVH